MRGESQRLSTHLKAAFAEIERLRIIYSQAIEQLAAYVLPNLSPQSAAQWFEMYLRVVDLGVEIRRGEIRHRTKQQFKYPCMQKTGTEGAVHSGLGIDDANVILQRMEDGELVKQSRLTNWFMKMDTLDRDTIGSLDEKVIACLEDFQRQKSVFYDRLEKTGEDPYEAMVVFGAPGADGSILAKVTRACFHLKDCSCLEDAEPWREFGLQSADPHAQIPSSTVDTAAGNDVGMKDIKRQMGFEELSREEKHEDTAALARDAAELARRRIPRTIAIVAGQCVLQSARSIYQKKCEEIGSKPKKHIKELLTVKDGLHHLHMSGIGFHATEDLQMLVDIFSTHGLPLVKELDISNGFFNAAAFQMLCQLLRVPQLRQSLERLSLRGIAVPLRGDFATLLRNLTGDSSSSVPALGNLKTLDISFNTLWFDGATQLQSLLSSLRCLENLSLESCFPEPELSRDRQALEESVHGALTDVSTRLECLNFGSNYVAMDSHWLDALFAPGSILQKLELCGISSSSSDVSDSTEPMEVDWQAGETWDLQQIETLKWSSNSGVHSDKLLGALSAELQSGFAQLKHLDVELKTSERSKKVADTIMHIADYAVLRSCRLCCSTRTAFTHGVQASIARLLEDGLQECEFLTLRVPQLDLEPRSICELLSSAVVPKMKKMTLAVGISLGGQTQSKLESCFLQMRKIQTLTLEFYDQSHAVEGVGAFARELETSWLSDLNASDSKVKRSFLLSEQQKATKRIYRCRFSAVTS